MRNNAPFRIDALGQCYVRSRAQYLLHFQKSDFAEVNSGTVCVSSERKSQLQLGISAAHCTGQFDTYDFLSGIVGEMVCPDFVNRGTPL